MLNAKTPDQPSLNAIKLLIMFELLNPGIVIPATKVNVINEFFSLKNVFQVLFHNGRCGNRFD
jgi:hypothetical protein